jgi:hypothetical protein
VFFVKNAEAAKAVLTRLAQSPQVRHWEFDISQDRKWQRADELIGAKPDCL